ncbi:hypothetical protein AAHA92_06331 [Salvia divinorum]
MNFQYIQSEIKPAEKKGGRETERDNFSNSSIHHISSEGVERKRNETRPISPTNTHTPPLTKAKVFARERAVIRVEISKSCGNLSERG